MVLGLERAVPMGSDDAPILRALNLERTEWPERLHRPVVFWIPEPLLGALGRAAPDFLDWRSDTLHFAADASRLERELAAFDTSLWQDAEDQRMSERDRRARVEELQSRLRLTPPGEDPEVEQARGSWLLELGKHLLFLGELSSAQETYEEFLELAKGLGDRRGLAAAHHQLGLIAQSQGRYAAALEGYRRSLVISERLGDREGMAVSYHQLGNISHLMARDEEALDWYQKALTIAMELGNRADVAASYHQLGVVALERGSYDEAAEWYQKSIAMKKELGDLAGLASSHHQLGNLAYLRGSYEESMSWYRRSLEISEKMGNRVGMAASWHQLGRVAEGLGSHQEAIESYRRSLRISEEIGDLAGVGRNVSQLGLLLTELGHTEEAVVWSLRALAVRLALGTSGAGIDLESLRRQRKALGEERFRELAEQHAESPGMAETVLGATAEPADQAAQEVAETPADYGAGGRSDDEE